MEKRGKLVAKTIPFREKKGVSNPFIAAAGSWKDINAEKMIDNIYKSRKDQSEKPLYSKKRLFALAGSIKSDSPMFKNPEKYIRELREESDKHRNFSR